MHYVIEYSFRFYLQTKKFLPNMIIVDADNSVYSINLMLVYYESI